MKTMWNVVSFVAVVNLLALGMFIGWLAATGRLSESRVEDLRTLFARPVAAVDAELAEQEIESEQERQRLRNEQLSSDPRPASTAQLAALARLDEREAQMLRSLRQESTMLLDQLERRTRALDAREQQLEDDRVAWEQSIAQAKAQTLDQQFQQAVKQLESLPGKQAKQVLMTLMDEGEVEQVVRYLDAMQPRSATKVLKEFKEGTEIVLAAELLERLRTHGVPASRRAGDLPPDDPSATQPDDLDQRPARAADVVAAGE